MKCRFSWILGYRHKVIFVSILFCSLVVFSQNKTLSDYKTLFELKKFQEVVGLLSDKLSELKYQELLILGRSYSELKNSASAIKVFTLATTKDPKPYEALTLLGKEQIIIKKEKEALKYLKEALDFNDKYEPAYNEIESIYLLRGNKYELRILLTDMLDKFGEKSIYINKLCEIYYQGAFYDLSLKTCRRGIVLNKDEPKNYIFLAFTFRETGKIEEYKNLIKKTAENFKDSHDAQLSYATFLEDQKNFPEALKYFKKSTEISPTSLKARIGYANSLVETKSLNEGYLEFSQACKLGKAALVPLKKSIMAIRAEKELDWAAKYETLVNGCGYNL